METDDGEDLDDAGYGETSRYAAHLDRGWSLLDRADHDAARHSAHHAQRLRPEAPDAAVLLGAIALAEGDPQEGLRWYDTAIELDPEYCEPYVAAAQIACFDLGDPARALQYCDEAMELAAATSIESLDLQILAAECEFSLGHDDAARRRLEPLGDHPLVLAVLAGVDVEGEPPAPAQGPEEPAAVTAAFFYDDDGDLLESEERGAQIHRVIGYCLRVCRLWLDLQQYDLARRTLETCVQRYPSHSDAWHLLSEVEFALGDPRAGIQAGLRVYRLDTQAPVPDWVPGPAQINRKIVELLAGCSDEALRELAKRRLALVILIHDVPSLELVLEGTDPRLPALALMSRCQPPDGSEGESIISGLAVYRRNILRLARDADNFDQELRYAVLDELATALQFSNDRRTQLGLGPLHDGGGVEEAPPQEEPEEPEEEERRAAPPRRRRKRVHN